MVHRFFYEGKYFGDVDNPLRGASEAWLCAACGRNFALRLHVESPSPHEGPLRWTFHEVLCAKCLAKNPLWQENFPFKLARFSCPFDPSNQLVTLRAQFLYDSTSMGFT